MQPERAAQLDEELRAVFEMSFILQRGYLIIHYWKQEEFL